MGRWSACIGRINCRPWVCSPLIVNRLDDEAEGRADSIDVLAHNLLHDGGLAGIVQATDHTRLATSVLQEFDESGG